MYKIIKRIIDITSSILILLIISPFFLLIMLLVKITSKGPIFYFHERVGLDGKPFKVIKFRTMYKDERPIEEILSSEQLKEYQQNYKIKNDPRVTKFGKILRKTSLDEIPQLLNIICGQMSLVGPRPIMKIETELMNSDDRKLYLSVLPGLTGNWAVNGRSSISYKERLQLELYYVEHKSLWLDLKIFFKTFFVFFINSE
ncbi:MAG: sugar transferase [Anaeroplasma sp.]